MGAGAGMVLALLSTRRPSLVVCPFVQTPRDHRLSAPWVFRRRNPLVDGSWQLRGCRRLDLYLAKSGRTARQPMSTHQSPLWSQQRSATKTWPAAPGPGAAASTVSRPSPPSSPSVPTSTPPAPALLLTQRHHAETGVRGAAVPIPRPARGPVLPQSHRLCASWRHLLDRACPRPLRRAATTNSEEGGWLVTWQASTN